MKHSYGVRIYAGENIYLRTQGATAARVTANGIVEYDDGTTAIINLSATSASDMSIVSSRTYFFPQDGTITGMDVEVATAGSSCA